VCWKKVTSNTKFRLGNEIGVNDEKRSRKLVKIMHLPMGKTEVSFTDDKVVSREVKKK
jgi:hypothetical protein